MNLTTRISDGNVFLGVMVTKSWGIMSVLVTKSWGIMSALESDGSHIAIFGIWMWILRVHSAV